MKKNLLLCSLLFSGIAFTQTNTEIKNDIDKIKTEIKDLKSEIQSVKSQNIYLKKVSDINTAILQSEKDNTSFKLIDVVGDSKNKMVSFSILIESKDKNKNVLIQHFNGIDLLGNEYKIERFKNITGLFAETAELTLNVPRKIIPILIAVPTETKILKLFKFKYFSSDSMQHHDIEFRDIHINWQ